MKMAKGEELIVVSVEDAYGHPLNIYIPVVVQYEAVTYIKGDDADGRRGKEVTEYLINDYRLDYDHIKKHPEITVEHVAYVLAVAETKFLIQIDEGTVGKCNLAYFQKT